MTLLLFPAPDQRAAGKRQACPVGRPHLPCRDLKQRTDLPGATGGRQVQQQREGPLRRRRQIHGGQLGLAARTVKRRQRNMRQPGPDRDRRLKGPRPLLGGLRRQEGRAT